nr:hypothetical protein Itr_chr13CG17900 [Ipomoea trifida]
MIQFYSLADQKRKLKNEEERWITYERILKLERNGVVLDRHSASTFPLSAMSASDTYRSASRTFQRELRDRIESRKKSKEPRWRALSERVARDGVGSVLRSGVTDGTRGSTAYGHRS